MINLFIFKIIYHQFILPAPSVAFTMVRVERLSAIIIVRQVLVFNEDTMLVLNFCHGHLMGTIPVGKLFGCPTGALMSN